MLAAVGCRSNRRQTGSEQRHWAAPPPRGAPEVVCFESRKGATEVQREIATRPANVKCSPTTGAALWGDRRRHRADGRDALMENPRGPGGGETAPTSWPCWPMCGTACHNGVPEGLPGQPAVPIPTMEAWCPTLKNLQHGRGRIWCLDCHHTTSATVLVDHFGNPVSMDQPQLLCGKCHGDKLRDWRDGIHGKRIGEWASTGKKRWFTCTECHNPHNVQDGETSRGFAAAARDAAAAARGMRTRRSERPIRSRTEGPTRCPTPTIPRPPERGDLTWVAPALTPDAATRHVGKTPVFFGPPG